MEKATFEDLIARKIQRDEDKLKVKEIEIDSTGKSLMFRKLSDSAMLDLMDELSEGESASGVVEVYKKLMYLSCDTFQDPKLQKELEVIDPYDTITAIFSAADIMVIGAKLMEFSDFGDIDEKVKN